MRIEHPVEFLALRSAAQLRKIFEELLYLARGLQGGDQPSGPLPEMGPGVRYLSRPKERIPWPQLVALISDLDHVLALEDVEPLVLLVVQVPSWPALLQRGDLGYGESAVGVQGRNLDVDQRPRESDLVLPAKPSFPGWYVSRMHLRAFSCHSSAPFGSP